jgi:hypothetical protein
VGNLWSSRELMRHHAANTLRQLMDHRATDGSRIRLATFTLDDRGRYGTEVQLTTDPVEHDPNDPEDVGAVE